MKLGAVANLIVPPEGADPLLGRIERAAELGVRVTGVSLRGDANRDPAYLAGVRELAARKNVELRYGGVGANFYLTGAEARSDLERATETLLLAREHLGVTFASTPAGPMLTTHRWTPGPPLEERLATVAENLGRLADSVGSAGVTLGLENHCDWRGHEIARIVESANRPNLRVQIDTGNAFSVFEEPVDCARALAPYVVSCHLKDIAVTPFASGEPRGIRGVSVPLGEGHVDNVTICRILQEQAPDPNGIALMVEPFYMPAGADPDAFLRTSLDWARRHLAEFLTD
jgi:sugar phosphate isomerase/epimerase